MIPDAFGSEITKIPHMDEVFRRHRLANRKRVVPDTNFIPKSGWAHLVRSEVVGRSVRPDPPQRSGSNCPLAPLFANELLRTTAEIACPAGPHWRRDNPRSWYCHGRTRNAGI